MPVLLYGRNAIKGLGETFTSPCVSLCLCVFVSLCLCVFVSLCSQPGGCGRRAHGKYQHH